MWFRSRGARIGATGLDAATCAGDGIERGGEAIEAMPHAQQATGQNRLERADGVGSIGAAGEGAWVGLGHRRVLGEQMVQIVRSDLRGKVLLESQVGQASCRFQAQPMLDPLEGFLDAPAAVVQRAEGGGGIVRFVEQRGHQDADRSGRRHIANQAHRGGRACQFVGRRIRRRGRGQLHDALSLAAAQKALDARPAARIHAHAEGALRLGQHRRHGVADQATIQHEQIVGGGGRERLEQHLPLRTIGRMQRGMQGQFRTGQIQGKRVVVRLQVGAAARGDLQTRTVGGDHAQPLPAVRINEGPGQADQFVVEAIEQLRGETTAHLREGAIAAGTHVHHTGARLREQVVEGGLHRGAHAGQHHRQHAWQGEGALSGERAGAKPERIDQGGVVKARRELSQQRGGVECLSSYSLVIKELQ